MTPGDLVSVSEALRRVLAGPVVHSNQSSQCRATRFKALPAHHGPISEQEPAR